MRRCGADDARVCGEISQEELNRLLGHEELNRAALLVLANKQVRDIYSPNVYSRERGSGLSA